MSPEQVRGRLALPEICTVVLEACFVGPKSCECNIVINTGPGL